jgi:DmsE family decaheme c-type cytochrome
MVKLAMAGSAVRACVLLALFTGLACRADEHIPSPYVGSTACGGCHHDIWQRFTGTAHFRSVAEKNRSPEHTGCEGCHGPARAHIEGHGDKTAIRSFATLSPQEKSTVCLECHANDFARANVRHSPHTEASVVCTNCHSIHNPATPRFLLAKQQTELCYGCHQAVRAQFSMPFKHRVNEGVIQCSDCHNPHGTFAPTWRMGVRPRMVDQRLGGEEACLACHQEKRGPFVFEHAAVRVEGCETCHVPHGSSNQKLLKRPVVFTVCLECHNGAGTFGRRANGIPLQSNTHNMLDPRYQHCTLCHAQIHGSNADAFFLR